MPDAKRDIISRLQQEILHMQGYVAPAADETKGLGLGPLETAFPNNVFPTGAIHEMLCQSPEQTAATSGFISGILSILMRQGGACLWISNAFQLFASSLGDFNVAAHQVIFINVPNERDMLWVAEEALKCEGLAAVVVAVSEVTMAQSRRLQLAVENSRVTGFLLRTNLRKPGINSCVARWQITPMPSVLEDGLPGVGDPRWQVELLRVRNGTPGTFYLEWNADGFVPVQPVESIKEATPADEIHGPAKEIKLDPSRRKIAAKTAGHEKHQVG